MRSRYLPLIAVLLAIPASASAQTPAAMTDGRTSLAFAIPESNGAQVSVWRFTSDRTKDWFATDEISIGGHTGVSASTSGRSTDDNDGTPWHIGTFNSALTMHIYF